MFLIFTGRGTILIFQLQTGMFVIVVEVVLLCSWLCITTMTEAYLTESGQKAQNLCARLFPHAKKPHI